MTPKPSTTEASPDDGGEPAPAPSWPKRWARRLWPWLKIYLIVCLLMMLLERYLVFPGAMTRDWDDAPGVPREDVTFHAADGTKLHGWFFEHEDPRQAVLFCHGNGGNLSHRASLMHLLREQLRLSIFIFDYRGYGKSDGSPDEAGILADARAARDWLARRTGKPPEELVLMGRSLGGAVAVDLAAKDGARGLILENTFTSLPDVAAGQYPFLPVRWFMRTRLNSLSKIGNYRGPLLQSHGTTDRVIPIELGRRLHAAVPDPDKVFFEFPGLDHNDYNWPAYKPALQRFLDRL